MSQIIRSKEDIAKCVDNKIILSDPESFSMKDSEIIINGKNNILYCEKNVAMENCRVVFDADNSVIYFSENRHVYKVDLTVNNNCACYLGRDGYYNKQETSNDQVRIICSEERTVFIGDEVLMAFGVWIRTADPHLVYSAETNKRMNPSESVFIGDHVWIGQNALILKGSMIHSGSILGGGAVLTGKKIPSNASYAGNPAKQIGENIYWAEPCVHKWTEVQTTYHRKFKGKERALFGEDESTIPFSTIDTELSSRETSEEKLEYLLEISANQSKNRFAMGSLPTFEPKGGFKKKLKKFIKNILK